ncbi:uncharacterized protein EV422DRAFT_518141 [Fimicolochytrium jonesii]|uniref:uncharacterized protein n=1 Tax=Fimicolochytrium jonesii TaxID=1396493 RepID=UPI0022FF1364|nr:uncharacterized protein EV422DRAFT_518141 [Fimicolochytrium jonesii]KAI8825266.1 hypothetical protein EV422DRAFT_518141 [Fimicolochytrium jonesii]
MSTNFVTKWVTSTDAKPQPSTNSTSAARPAAPPAAPASPAPGFTDTLHLPFDFNVYQKQEVLRDIAAQDGLKIACEPLDNTLIITADTVQALENGRHSLNELIYHNKRPVIVSKTPMELRIPKPDRPGNWGQPREECAKGDGYKLMGERGDF